VGNTVTAVTLAEGSVWLASSGDSSVYRLDPRTMSVQSRIRLPEPPQEAAAGAGSVWVTTHQKLIRIDPSSDSIEQEFPLGPCTDTFGGYVCQTDVAVGEGAVWATHYDSQRLVEVDPARDTVVDIVNMGSFPMALATGHGAVWVLPDDAASPTIERIDLVSGSVSSEALPRSFLEPACLGYGRTAFAGELCVAIGVGDLSIWVATPGDVSSELWRLDPATGNRQGRSTPLPCCVMAITRLWSSCRRSGPGSREAN
jgi:streptogramin lyase